MNGTDWYRVWSDGWIEQGGCYTAGSSAVSATINFLKAFSDTNYTVNVTMNSTYTSTSQVQLARLGSYNTKSTGSFTMYVYANTYVTAYDWRACGY